MVNRLLVLFCKRIFDLFFMHNLMVMISSTLVFFAVLLASLSQGQSRMTISKTDVAECFVPVVEILYADKQEPAKCFVVLYWKKQQFK